MKLHIKYMVSFRCKMIVRAELQKLGIAYLSLELGELILLEDISPQNRLLLRNALSQSGLELMDDQKAILIEKIKNTIVEMVHYQDELPKVNFSDLLAEKLACNYTYLAKLFSHAEGRTIENYIILHKIERVKELILYDELNLSEIAYKLHYSSLSALSNQFKKITGLTPSFFKSLKHQRRRSLEEL